jgi:membrane fusion protein, copper/silver efflux system
MKIDKNKFGLGVLFLALGLGMGWLFFHKAEDKAAESTHQHAAGDQETIWTCSMHPQIRQNEPGLCPICGMDLIPLDNAAGDDDQALEMSPTAIKLANIQTTKVQQAQAVKEILLNGRIKADERRVYSQVAHVPGRIEKLYIDYTGKYIKTGQKLAEVYSPELITAQEELLEAKKYASSNPMLLEAARNKLKLWKISAAQIRAIEQSGRVRTNLPIRADVSGYVMEKNVNLGDHLDQGEIMFQIADLNKVWAMFEAYESDLSWLNTGDPISFTVSSLPGKTFEAKISYIDPVIDPVKRVAMVRAEVTNTAQQLKPEMFVKGKVSANLDEQHKGLIIPESAVMWTGKRSVVYVKDTQKETPTFRMQEVILGENLGHAYIVEKGLQEGQLVVSNGTFTIDAAAQLKGLPSMMNPEGTDEAKEGTSEKLKTHTPEQFQKQLTKAFEEYLKLKDALIATDTKKAAQAALAVQQALKEVDMKLLKGKTHDDWMQQSKSMNSKLILIADSDELSEQRLVFADLSNVLYESIKAFGIENKVYYQYCPMANKNQGAFWLSAQEEIRNPYMNKAMLGCGETKEVLTNE